MVFDSAIAAVGQTLRRPKLSSLYAALVSVSGLAAVTSDGGPLQGLSTARTYLSDHPSTYLNLVQLWITEHRDLIAPASWSLLVLAAGVLGFQGHVALRTNVAATCRLFLAGLGSLQISRALMLVVLGAIVAGRLPCTGSVERLSAISVMPTWRLRTDSSRSSLPSSMPRSLWVPGCSWTSRAPGRQGRSEETRSRPWRRK